MDGAMIPSMKPNAHAVIAECQKVTGLNYCTCCDGPIWVGRGWLGKGYAVCDQCGVILGMSYTKPVSDREIKKRIENIRNNERLTIAKR